MQWKVAPAARTHNVPPCAILTHLAARRESLEHVFLPELREAEPN